MENFQHSLTAHLAVKGSANSSPLIILILPAMGAPTRLYQYLYEEIQTSGLGVAIIMLMFQLPLSLPVATSGIVPGLVWKC